MLTHMGSSLADVGADDFVPSDGVRAMPWLTLQCCGRDARHTAQQEEDEELNDLITREYHFGGGLFTRKDGSADAGEADADGGAELPPKTKKEVMMEIIAKSKSAKRERVKEKEADDEQLDALDLTFKALADVRPPRACLRRLHASLTHHARRLCARRRALSSTACARQPAT